MMELQAMDLHYVCGANATMKVIEAISVAAQLYEGTALIIDQSSIVQSTEVYVKLGHELGEHLFNLTHPNPLGKMIYYPSDF